MKATTISLFINDLNSYTNKDIMLHIAEVCKFTSKEVMIRKEELSAEYNISNNEIDSMILKLYHYECLEEEEIKKENEIFAKYAEIAKKYNFSYKDMMKEKEKISNDYSISKIQAESLIAKLRGYTEFAQENMNKEYDKLIEELNYLKARWWRSRVIK